MAGKASDGSIKWQLCYDISARTWWMYQKCQGGWVLRPGGAGAPKRRRLPSGFALCSLSPLTLLPVVSWPRCLLRSMWGCPERPRPAPWAVTCGSAGPRAVCRRAGVARTRVGVRRSRSRLGSSGSEGQNPTPALRGSGRRSGRTPSTTRPRNELTHMSRSARPDHLCSGLREVGPAGGAQWLIVRERPVLAAPLPSLG
ncbi:Nuclear factor 1 A-type [Fukomys damarensis]|uniref:Nuclear factor 1 A-type n=1 Tax=Fukomys damarensis TaxID=885580 RepID=A0A091CY44_FUKDA|nr:Nuclear factor 1 A-type [Fukomys damarensis]